MSPSLRSRRLALGNGVQSSGPFQLNPAVPRAEMKIKTFQSIRSHRCQICKMQMTKPQPAQKETRKSSEL